jgi:hypothetical protein
MDPKTLGITQSIILRLNLGEHHCPLLMIPQEQVRDSATALLILLRHDFADGSKCFSPETLHNLNQVI